MITKYKKFVTPKEVRVRFRLTKEEYNSMLENGLPLYVCAGVSRHAIDEVYDWLKENNSKLVDFEVGYCTGFELRKMLGITKKELEIWETYGLTKILTYDRKGKERYYYNKESVVKWLRSHNYIVTKTENIGGEKCLQH